MRNIPSIKQEETHLERFVNPWTDLLRSPKYEALLTQLKKFLEIRPRNSQKSHGNFPGVEKTKDFIYSFVLLLSGNFSTSLGNFPV